MKKKYNSIEEVNQELKILKVQRELDFYKMVRSYENLKEGITPCNILSGLLGSVTSSITKSRGITTFILTTILKFFLRRKKRK